MSRNGFFGHPAGQLAPHTLGCSDPPDEVQPRSERNPGNVKSVSVGEIGPVKKAGSSQDHSCKTGLRLLKP